MTNSKVPNADSFDPKTFVGKLSIDDNEIEVKFELRGDSAGDFFIEIERFPYDAKSRFIKELHYENGTTFSNYTLIGAANDDARFKCENVIFTSLRERWDREEGATMAPMAHYSKAYLTISGEQVLEPVVTWRLKGFASFYQLSASCEVGEVFMEGVSELSKENVISGRIVVKAVGHVSDANEWRARADALCDHVRHVMSFAAGTFILCPVREFALDKSVQIKLLSQNTANIPETAAFQPMNLDQIFQCAVRSFFDPKYQIENLKFAITWFSMRSGYTEGMLITSMTVLENLLDSNLSSDDVFLMSDRRLKKLKKKLREVIRNDLLEWVDDQTRRDELLLELDGRLVDLKRKSLIEKLLLLADRWGVQLSDIPHDEIKEAKRARDHVVHCGYYERGPSGDDGVYECVLTVRELVVRFILTALGFEGDYWSYRGGYHSRRLEVTA